MFGTIRELGPERLERCLVIELGGFQQMLRLGQYFLSFRRTRIGRTGNSEFDTWIRVSLVNLLLDALLDMLRSPLRLEEDQRFW